MTGEVASRSKAAKAAARQAIRAAGHKPGAYRAGRIRCKRCGRADAPGNAAAALSATPCSKPPGPAITPPSEINAAIRQLQADLRMLGAAELAHNIHERRRRRRDRQWGDRLVAAVNRAQASARRR